MTELFKIPSATRRDPVVEEWLRSRSPEPGPVVRMWFDQMRKCGPDVTELIHDGCPVACIGDVALGYVNAFAAHVNVGFFLGATYDEMALSRLIEDAYMDVKRRVADSAA
jgi:hypothetical protein